MNNGSRRFAIAIYRQRIAGLDYWCARGVFVAVVLIGIAGCRSAGSHAGLTSAPATSPRANTDRGESAVLSTEYSVPSTQDSVPSTRHSVPSTRCNEQHSDRPQSQSSPRHPLTASPPPITRVAHETGEPDDFPTLTDDLHAFLHNLRDDTKGLANVNNAALLGLSVGAAIGIRQDLDDQVRENTARHPERWGGTSNFLGRLGEAPYQVTGLAAFYAYSRYHRDKELHAVSESLVSAFTLTGLSTLAVKGIANTDRPSDDWNGGKWGFPSWHAGSSFTMAAVLDEYYGPNLGLPAYALAGLISWSRIDERDHDLSDVVFGAAMGYIIGKSVAGGHLTGDGRVRILPWVHPGDGASGLLIDVSY